MTDLPQSPQTKEPSFFARFIARAKENRQKVLAAKAAKRGGGSLAPQVQDLNPAAHQQEQASAKSDSAVAIENKRYAYVSWLLRVLNVSILTNAFCLILLVMTAIMAGRRPVVQLIGPPSLRAEAQEMFGRDTEVNVDDLLIYLNTVLPLMHRIDDRGAPELPLLRGLIAPSVYEMAQKEAERGAKLAKKNFIIQNLVVTKVEEVEILRDRGRISAYVRGYLAIIIQSKNRPIILPYRAEVLMEMAPPSRLNRFPFVLIRREWKTDKAALEWDTQRARSKPANALPNTAKPAEPAKQDQSQSKSK